LHPRRNAHGPAKVGDLETFYEDPEAFLGEGAEHAALIVDVLKLRQSLTRAMKGKLETITESLDPAQAHLRARDWCVYYGAHTGRFTSRRIQLHNMSRGIAVDKRAIIDRVMALPMPEAEDDAIRVVEEEVRAAEVRERQRQGKEVKFDLDDALATLVRPVFCAAPGNVLGIVDYTLDSRFGRARSDLAAVVIRTGGGKGRDVAKPSLRQSALRRSRH
jgi:hypothetical protein